MNLQPWIIAARPRTLPAAAAPVLIALALAWRDGVFDPLPGLACLFISLLMQIGANFANDLFDHQRGADTPERLGPTRATAAGLLTPRQMAWGTAIIFGLAALLGLYIIALRGWPIVWLGIGIVLAALAYTGGPFPYGYHALGDVFVFLTFGLAAVVGTYYAQAGAAPAAAWLAAIAPGLLIVNILVVNNTRDMPTDQKSNKRTLAVTFGRKAMHLEYLVCLIGAYLIPFLMWMGGFASWGGLLALLSAPKAAGVYRAFTATEGRALNQTLAETAQVSLLFCTLFAIGLLIP